jgi:hypothetical protein
MADYKYIGLHSAWSKKESDLDGVRVTFEDKFWVRAGLDQVVLGSGRACVSDDHLQYR